MQTLYPRSTEDECLKKIELTPMIGVNDTNELIFTLDDAKKLIEWAKAKRR